MLCSFSVTLAGARRTRARPGAPVGQMRRGPRPLREEARSAFLMRKLVHMEERSRDMPRMTCLYESIVSTGGKTGEEGGGRPDVSFVPKQPRFSSAANVLHQPVQAPLPIWHALGYPYLAFSLGQGACSSPKTPVRSCVPPVREGKLPLSVRHSAFAPSHVADVFA